MPIPDLRRLARTLAALAAAAPLLAAGPAKPGAPKLGEVAAPITIPSVPGAPVTLSPAAISIGPASAGTQGSALQPEAIPLLNPAASVTRAPSVSGPGAILPTDLSKGPGPESAGAQTTAVEGLRTLGAELVERPAAEHLGVLGAAWDQAARPGAAAEPELGDASPSPAHPRSALARAPLRDLVVSGVPSGMARVVEGEVLFWDPKRDEVDPYLAAPDDDKNTVAAKVRNEVEALRRVWLDLRSAIEAKLSPATLARADELVEAAKARVEGDGLRAEIVVERLAAAAKGTGGHDLEQAAVLAKTELVPALRNRSSLLYLTDDRANMDLAKFHEDLKRLASDRVLSKIHDRFLRSLYGFDAGEPGSAMGERAVAEGRRVVVREFQSGILADIAAGKTAEQAVDQALSGVRKNVDMMKSKVVADPKNQTLKKNFTFFEEIAAGFEAVKDGLRAHDYVFERSDLPDIVRSKKEAEYARHEAAWAKTIERAPSASDAARALLRELKAHLGSAILDEGRPLQYAAAQFFHRRYDRLSELNGSENDRGQEGPLDLLMFYSHAARGGASEAEESRDLVVLTREIRDEADYQDLRLSFRDRGRVVSVATVGAPDAQGGSRMPHWVIFAKADGIVPVPWADLGAAGLSPGGLAERLERNAGRPATAVVNGRRGQLLINPSARTRGDWLARARIYESLDEHYKSRALRPASFAGAPVRFLADEASPAALHSAKGPSAVEMSGAAGVGLLRMEQFMRELGVEWDPARLASSLKSILEGPQFRAGAPLIVRLFDFESDKIPGFLRDRDPAGARALLKTHSNVRFYLDKSRPEFREFGKMQLKALFDSHLASRPGGNLRVLFSNVQTPKEVRGIEALVQEAAAEYVGERRDAEAVLKELGRIPIGYMVEDKLTVRKLKPLMAAIAAVRAERPAERFLAFGTNDYQSSLLRDDPRAFEKLGKLDPRLVQGIWAVAKAATAHGFEFTIDGEWGSSPKLLLALMALRAQDGTQATPVVYPARAPELYELVRELTMKDLERGRGRRGDGSLKSLVKRLTSGRGAPALEPFDAAVSALAHALEDRVLQRLAERDPADPL